jgi:ABC-type lipoprotein export system ATPase subunit
MIVIENLHKQFGKKVLFSGVSLTLDRTGLVIISGSSGSGKSTFLKCLNGLSSYQGMIEVDGIYLNKLDSLQRLHFRQRDLGAVYQHIGLLEETTIEETLMVAAQLKGLIYANQKETFDLLLKFLPNISIKHPVKKLSFGQRQRVALIRAMMGQPKILLFDEPTTGLDLKQRKMIQSLIALASQTALVFLITHDHDLQKMVHHQHLVFPLIQRFTKKQPVSAKKYPRKLQPGKLSFWWMIKFQWKKLNEESGRIIHSLLQSIIFILLTTLLSLSSVINIEFNHYTSQLIGGKYQYIESIQQENTTVYSANTSHVTSFDVISDNDVLSYYYDSEFINQLQSYHYFSIENEGFSYVLKDFTLSLINDFEYLPFSENPMMHPSTLQLHQVMLGVQAVHLRLLAQVLGVFPTVESINQRLFFDPLLVYIHTDQIHWGYKDVFSLEVKTIIASESPSMWHSHPLFSMHVFESLMQFPTKDIAEHYENTPWRIGKTVATLSLHVEKTIEQFFTHSIFHRFHLQRKNKNRLIWFVMHHAMHSVQHPPLIIENRLIHHTSHLGYHYYPEQNLSGFAQLVTLSKDKETLSLYQKDIDGVDEVLKKLAILPHETMARGHILLPDIKNVKFQPTLIPINIDEIILSQDLASTLKVEVNDSVYLSLASFTNMNSLPNPIKLTVKAIDTSLVHHRIMHNHTWLHHLLVTYFHVPSSMLHPLGWSIYDSKDIHLKSWNIHQPFLKMQQQIDRWTHYLYLMIVSIFLLFGIPVLIAFYTHFFRHLERSKRIYQTLVIQGAGYDDILQFGSIKLSLIIGELFILISSGFLSVDYFIYLQLKQNFLVDAVYQWPLGEWAVITSVVVLVWTIIQEQLKRTLQTILTIH